MSINVKQVTTNYEVWFYNKRLTILDLADIPF